jgi:hypothetical protein
MHPLYPLKCKRYMDGRQRTHARSSMLTMHACPLRAVDAGVSVSEFESRVGIRGV